MRSPLVNDPALLAFDKVLAQCARRKRVTRQQDNDKRLRRSTGCAQIHIQALRVVLRELE